jgi:hypothetical protein
MSDLKQALRTVGSFILRLVIEQVLQKLCFQSEDSAIIATVISNFAEDESQLKAVFAAAMPLVQTKPTSAHLQALLVEVLRLGDGNKDKDDETLKQEAMAMMGRAVQPMLETKLEALGMPDTTRLARLASQAASSIDQVQAVLTAALPLVQGKPTVAAVEGLLVAVLRLDKDKEKLDNDALKAKALCMIAEAVQPLMERKLEALGMPDATRLAKLASQAASKPKQAQEIFAAIVPMMQGKPTVTTVEGLLVTVLRLDRGPNKLDESTLKSEALRMIGRAAKPLVQRKLEALDLQPEDMAIVSTAIEKLLTEDNTQKLQAVFAAAMPLVQGSVTVSKVEALLEAATGLSKEEVLGMIGRAARPLVQRKLEALNLQPEDMATVSTAIEKLLKQVRDADHGVARLQIGGIPADAVFGGHGSARGLTSDAMISELNGDWLPVPFLEVRGMPVWRRETTLHNMGNDKHPMKGDAGTRYVIQNGDGVFDIGWLTPGAPEVADSFTTAWNRHGFMCRPTGKTGAWRGLEEADVYLALKPSSSFPNVIPVTSGNAKNTLAAKCVKLEGSLGKQAEVEEDKRDNKKKLQAVFAAAMPLVQGPVTVSKVEALLEATTGLSKEEVLGMVGRATNPLVQRKLEALNLHPEDMAPGSTAIEKLLTEDNTQKLQSVFAATMPLVQGPVTVSKVEALLEAATGLSKEEVLGMVGRAAKPLVQRKLDEPTSRERLRRPPFLEPLC